MPATIDQNQTLLSEVVLSQRVATTEYRVLEIQESIKGKNVRVLIELGPFTLQETYNQQTVLVGTEVQSLTVWENDEYESVRDTWSNSDLLSAITAKLNG